MLSSKRDNSIFLVERESFKSTKEPIVQFSDEEIDRLSTPFEYTLVGQFPEGKPSLDDICDDLKNFGLHGKVTVGIVDVLHVLIKCNERVDFNNLWTKQKWKICEKTIQVFKWNSGFKPLHESSLHLVWVNLPQLSIELFNKDALKRIGDSLGRVIHMDWPTVDAIHPGLARFCVEIDVSKTLPESICIVKGDQAYSQELVYENIPKFCKFCWKIGHLNEECMFRNPRGLTKTIGFDHLCVSGWVDDNSVVHDSCPVCEFNLKMTAEERKKKKVWIELDNVDSVAGYYDNMDPEYEEIEQNV